VSIANKLKAFTRLRDKLRGSRLTLPKEATFVKKVVSGLSDEESVLLVRKIGRSRKIGQKLANKGNSVIATKGLHRARNLERGRG
jgi:hypothetical protein